MGRSEKNSPTDPLLVVAKDSTQTNPLPQLSPPAPPRRIFQTMLAPPTTLTPALAPHLLARIFGFVPCDGKAACGCAEYGITCGSSNNTVLSVRPDLRPTCEFQRTLVSVGTVPIRAALRGVRRRNPRSLNTHPNDWLAAFTAVSRDGFALEFASRRLRDDKEIALAAVSRDGFALEYASMRLRDDRDVALAAVTRDGYAIKWVSGRLRDDRGVVSSAVFEDSYALECASARLKDDRGVVLLALADDSLMLEYASARLRDDPEVVAAAVTSAGRPHSTRVLDYASPRICDDESTMLLFVAHTDLLLRRASVRLRDNRAVVMAAVTANTFGRGGSGYDASRRGPSGTSLQYASERLRDDRDVVLNAVTSNGRAILHASARLRDDREVVLAAVSENRCMIDYASERLQLDIDVLRRGRVDAML